MPLTGGLKTGPEFGLVWHDVLHFVKRHAELPLRCPAAVAMVDGDAAPASLAD